MLLICDWLTFRFDFQTGIKKSLVCEMNTFLACLRCVLVPSHHPFACLLVCTREINSLIFTFLGSLGSQFIVTSFSYSC